MNAPPRRKLLEKRELSMPRTLEPYQMIERSIIKKYRDELWKPFVYAVKKYELIQAGDKIAVCISGGKDSMLMAKLMQELHRHSDVPFDPGYNAINRQRIESNAVLLHIPITVFETNIFEVANSTDKSPCYLCARMRRGHLYSKAKELGCNKIALGHHFDDAVETFLMSLLYEGRIGCFEPVTYLSRTDVTQIRPLLYVKERQVVNAAKRLELPIVENPCPANGETRRQEIKELIASLEGRYPDLKQKIFGAMQRYPLYGWGVGGEDK